MKILTNLKVEEELIKLGRKLSNNNRWLGLYLPGEVIADTTIHEVRNYIRDIHRTDSFLIEAAELVNKDYGYNIVEVPDNIQYGIIRIEDGYGPTFIYEKNHLWGNLEELDNKIAKDTLYKVNEKNILEVYSSTKDKRMLRVHIMKNNKFINSIDKEVNI